MTPRKKNTPDDEASEGTPSPAELAPLIDEYLAPEQPDDCREASRAKLVAALRENSDAAPIVHRGKQISLDPSGDSILVEDAPAENVDLETAGDVPPA